MTEDYQRVIAQLSALRRQMADTFQVGTVHEVKGDKLRMVIGKDKKGKEVLSPWLNTSNHRGGATEARFYKKGQTLQLICPNGDMAMGSIAPYAPNKNFQRPEQANENSDGEESYQLENYRQKQSKDGNDMWLQDEEKKQEGQQGQQGGGQQQQKKGHSGGAKAKLKSRMNKDGGITHRVGTDSRVAAHKDGAKLRTKADWVVVTTKGQIIMSKPPIIQRDPIPNDDA